MTDRSRTDMQARQDKIAVERARVVALWQQRVRNMPQAQRILDDLLATYDKMLYDAKETRATRAKLRADEVTKPEVLQRRHGEAREAGDQQFAASVRAADALRTSLVTLMKAVATPQIPAGREAAARQELYMLVKNSPDPELAMREAVQRGGELAAVAASSYGESLLRAQGAHKPVEAHKAIVDVARAVAIKSDDPTTREAAEVLRAIDGPEGLDAMHVPSLALARWDLEAAETGE